MLLYMSSQKFGNDTEILKNWIKNHNNKIVIIPNALDAKGEDGEVLTEQIKGKKKTDYN